MKLLKILVKDLKKFIKEEEVCYASGEGKRLFVKLHAGPNIERYIVRKANESKGFAVAGNAVKYFNEL